ncbi:DUF6011 domain-containing protein [Gordonia alkanivorans]|uniref:DUF6011 domain-containing protein n=1 Tax=Gordonia alkanivorans TaxID=84096 RepID=UPI00244C2EB6|nr:DUF6011 domain-containing protein [Gordonia alkanivorans]MDH3026415.1 DUF6011 domain-containing protein [Gordonia alkanivorans]
MSRRNADAPGRRSGGSRENQLLGSGLDVESITEIDLDQYLEPADRLMLAALRDGRYVLAVVCLVCGKPLTSKRSRARGVGPACRKRVAGDD